MQCPFLNAKVWIIFILTVIDALVEVLRALQ